MKLFKPYRPILYSVLLFIIISFMFFYFYTATDKSNLYTAIATFVVGCFAIWLYIRQKVEQKRDAANVILAEIRYAEKLIDQFKDAGISTCIKYQILPIN